MLFGVANSAFQVEGFPNPSDWKAWTQTPSKIQDGSDANHATEFWTRYEVDFKLAKELGSNAFRISLAWERIEPKEDLFDPSAIDHYAEILRSMVAHGLEPIVTLHHFVNPDWIAARGGILSPDFPVRFARFAAYAVESLSKKMPIRYWITFNEPSVLVRSSFLEGLWPPGHKDDFKSAATASFHLAKAHLLALQRIRAFAPDPKVLSLGIAAHLRAFQPKTKSVLDRLACRLVDWVFNRQILNSSLTGRIRSWFPGSPYLSETIRLEKGLRGLDFLGVNYYGRTMVSFKFKPPFIEASEGEEGARSDMGWEVYPQGLTDVLKDAHTRYQMPLLVTENGIADQKDKMRAEFIQTHLDALFDASKAGVPVLGYLHWSLTDNFEWDHGIHQRFGLVEIDYKTQKRIPRPSFYSYRELISRYQK